MDYATRSASCHPIRCLANSYSQQNAHDSLKGLQRYKRGEKRGPNSGERRLPGGARVSRVGFGVSPKRSLKVRETETISPARETRTLLGSLRSPEQLECAGPI